METAYARQQLLDLVDKEEPGNGLALEIAGLLASFFSERDITIGLFRGQERFFYSTLPGDEALFYKVSVGVEEMDERPGAIYCERITLSPGGGYTGYLVLEGGSGYSSATDEVHCLIHACAFSMAFCFAMQRSQDQVQLDPQTGLPGRYAFLKSLKVSLNSGRNGYLLAVCYDAPHSHAGYDTRESEERFCEMAKQSQLFFEKSYRISDTTVVMLTDREDREELFRSLQELSQLDVYIGAVFLPLSGLTAENVFHRLAVCLAQCADGRIHGPMVLPEVLKPFRISEGRRGET